MITDYFHTIDSYDKAYWLGFLFADGNVYKRKDRPNGYRIQFKLKDEDGYMVHKFHDTIDCHINVRNEPDGTRLIFTNNDMGLNLINWGCIPNKSKVVKFPYNLPDEYKWSFVRGYFDGNGSYQKHKNGCFYWRIHTGSKNFQRGIIDFLKEYGINLKEHDKQRNGCYEVSTAKREHLRIILPKMYENANDLYLKRKHDYAVKYANTEVTELLK